MNIENSLIYIFTQLLWFELLRFIADFSSIFKFNFNKKWADYNYPKYFISNNILLQLISVLIMLEFLDLSINKIIFKFNLNTLKEDMS